MKLQKREHLTLVGDIHGEWKTLCNELKKNKIWSGIVIIVGDCGIGSEKDPYWRDLSKMLHHRLPGVLFLCLRGNHDNSDRFKAGPERLDYDNLKTLIDYEILEIGDLRFLPIGGAVSLDRDWRGKVNSKYEHFGSHKRIWWPSEKIDTSFISPDIRIDWVLSHAAPSFGPISTRSDDMSEELWFDIKEEREFLQEVLVNVNPSHWTFGHYHMSLSGTTGTTMWKALDIVEVFNIY